MATEKRQRQKANRQLKYQQQARQDQRHKRTRRGIILVVAVVGGVGLVLLLGLLVNRGDDEPEVLPTVPTTLPSTVGSTAAPASTVPGEFAYGTGECPPAEVTEPVRTFDDAPQLCIDPAASYSARFVTDRGEIVVELDAAAAPGTVNNFVTLARYGYYDDTLLFRTNTSIDIVQGGGRTNTDRPGYEIPDEDSGYTYEVGQLAMARTQAPNSAGGQWFFIVTEKGLDSLASQGTYVPFGQVTEGLDVLADVLALAGEDGDTPTEEVVLETIEITEA